MNDLKSTGDDFIAYKDVCSIVLELPNSALAPERLNLWARTLVDAGSKWVQAGRGACPRRLSCLSERRETHASRANH